jgi:hypothetical protein
MKRHHKEHQFARAKRMRKPSRHEKGHKKSKWQLFIARSVAL